MRKYIILTLLVSVLCSFEAIGQDSLAVDSVVTPSHFLERKVEADKVILRWAPSDYTMFNLGLEYGYVLQRKAYTKNSELEESEEIDADFKTIVTIKPYTVEEWKANAKDASDIYAGVAMQIQHGEVKAEKSTTDEGALLNQYENEMRKFSYALLASDFSATAARGLGLRYEDQEVKAGQYYEYRVIINTNIEGLKLDTATTWADMNLPTELFPVRHCFTEVEDKKISVFWTRHNDQFFSAYDVERSTDGTNWKKLTNKPFITSRTTLSTPNFYVDTNVMYGKKYTYRVRGYTAFGEKGLFSEPFSEKGADLKAPAPAWGLKAEDLGGYVGLSWEAKPIEPDFDGFYIERSTSASGYFERISDKLPTEAREFADLMPLALESNYYRIVCVDASGNEAHSFAALGYLVDSVPPIAPTGLIGEIDTNGIVSLKWSAADEADVIGYRVYWSNNKENEFTQLTGDILPLLTYADSINIKTLNEEIYYKIAAVDHRYNHSEPSEILTLKKPDIVPPAAPLIYKYKVTSDTLVLQWYASRSTDVISQRILRKIGNESWKEVFTTKNSKTEIWKDNKLEDGKAYAYKIVATDDAGNTTESEIFKLSKADDGLQYTDISTKIEVNGDSAMLSWSKLSQKAKFIIYKVRGNEQTKLVSVYSPNTSFIDKNYLENDLYKMRILYPSGKESQLLLFKK